MPNIKIYRVTLAPNTSGNVSWIECEGNSGPDIFLDASNPSIEIEAQEGTVTAPAGADIGEIGVGNSNCMGGSTTTTTTIAVTTTTTEAPTTTTLSPETFTLQYHATSALLACTSPTTTLTYYARPGSELVNSTQLFTTSGLTTPAANGYYSDGFNFFIVSEVGFLNDKATCVSATTTTTTTTTTTAPGTTTTTTAAGTTTTTTTIAPGAFNVTNNGSSNYIINGNSNPTLTVTEGEIYTFNISSVGHPFWIKTVNSTGTVNQYNIGVTNNGTDDGTITWTVSYDAPSTLYYSCQFHSAMAGTINVIDVPIATTSTTTTTAAATTTTTTDAGTTTTTTTTTAAETTTTTTAAETTTTTTEAETTTTTTAGETTTTTTAGETTTTTTAALTCKEYQITSTDPTYGADISGTLCDNTSYSDTGFFGTVNLCFLENQIFVSGGTFSLIGDCTPPTTTTTAAETTTTTTAAETTTTTTAAETTTTTTAAETTTTTTAAETTTTTTTAAPTTTTTTTTTTTAAPSETFFIENVDGAGTVDDVTSGGLDFIVITTGNFPLSSGEICSGTQSSLTGANVEVEISGTSAYGCLALYINTVPITNIATSGTGTYTFTGVTITTSDIVEILYTNGACP
jgi:hypothetical protein